MTSETALMLDALRRLVEAREMTISEALQRAANIGRAHGRFEGLLEAARHDIAKDIDSQKQHAS